MQKEKIICVVGPTASGKSALAVDISKMLDAEIISCDSMQLYKGMDIGTAKSTKEEMQGIKHHLIDILEIDEQFSVSDYVKLADVCVKDVFARDKRAVFCGGTGLYIDSYISGISFGDYDSLPEYRLELEEFAKTKGAAALHEMLEKIDADAAQKIDKENIKRVIRALEVYKATGITITEWNKKALSEAKKKDALYIGLTYTDRSVLYERIEKRVDKMLEMGLLEETERLINKGLRTTQTAGQAIGYKEFYPYFDGVSSLAECIERLKINSRQYAKRQLTWFSRNKDIVWIDASLDEKQKLDKAKQVCLEFLNK